MRFKIPVVVDLFEELSMLGAADSKVRSHGPTIVLTVMASLGLGAVSCAGAAASPVPGLRSRIARYVARRPGHAAVAVYDAVANRYTTVQNAMTSQTASIIKVDILETRLHQTHGQLSASDRGLAKRMIEQSDNAAATALWHEDGGARGIGAYNRLVGMTCTSLDQFGYWGLTWTCARDQLRLLRVLDVPNSLLRRAARRYELYLMKHVIRSQAWGVTAGVPAGMTVALKNGWLPHDSVPWIVNSIGIVTGNDRHYTIAVLTRDASEQQGITTIEGISKIVWNHVERTP